MLLSFTTNTKRCILEILYATAGSLSAFSFRVTQSKMRAAKISDSNKCFCFLLPRRACRIATWHFYSCPSAAAVTDFSLSPSTSHRGGFSSPFPSCRRGFLRLRDNKKKADRSLIRPFLSLNLRRPQSGSFPRMRPFSYDLAIFVRPPHLLLWRIIYEDLTCTSCKMISRIGNGGFLVIGGYYTDYSDWYGDSHL